MCSWWWWFRLCWDAGVEKRLVDAGGGKHTRINLVIYQSSSVTTNEELQRDN